MQNFFPPSSSTPNIPLKCALTIATSDSGGGAGIEADLKTFAAHGVFGFCALSAVTAQNTTAVTALESLSPEMVTAQLQALYDDFEIGAIKIGLLGSAANTRAAAGFIRDKLPQTPLVVDPVMVSTSGHTFLAEEAIEALKELMSLATLVTPNLPEAKVLAGQAINDDQQRIEAAKKILSITSAGHVLIKGGHGHSPEARDLFYGSGFEMWFDSPRIDTPNTHGTGCTLSSAICANLASGLELTEAVERAKGYVTEALRHSISLGHGPGPLNHFYRFYNYNPKSA